MSPTEYEADAMIAGSWAEEIVFWADEAVGERPTMYDVDRAVAECERQAAHPEEFDQYEDPERAAALNAGILAELRTRQFPAGWVDLQHGRLIGDVVVAVQGGQEYRVLGIGPSPLDGRTRYLVQPTRFEGGELVEYGKQRTAEPGEFHRP